MGLARFIYTNNAYLYLHRYANIFFILYFTCMNMLFLHVIWLIQINFYSIRCQNVVNLFSKISSLY